jgi:hypothetical protein
VKTYPIKRPDGLLHAFEIGNAFISMGTIRRILSSIDGVSSLSRQFRSDDRLTFVFLGAPWIVNEPWGDSSRYWIGPADAENHSVDVGPIHNAFVSYKSPVTIMLQNFKAMPGILKWITVLCMVLPVFTLGTFIPNGTINVNNHPMANSDFWACGAGILVAILAMMMLVAMWLLVQRSKYARLVALIAFMAAWMSGPLLGRLLDHGFKPSILLVSSNLIPVAVMALYFYKNTAARTYFQPRNA